MGFAGVQIPQGAVGADNAVMFTQVAMSMENTIAIQNQIGPFAISRSQRNPTALFGAGLIDSITEAQIEAAAKVKHPGFAEIAGRVSRLKDKRIGRFGWKAQTPSLDDFVLTACAVELGLEVPAHHQGGLPAHPEAKPKGLDLNAEECASLVAYVGNLPRPAQRKPESDREANEVEAGRRSLPRPAARRATRRSWERSTDFTATCCCMIWGRRWEMLASTACSIQARPRKRLWMILRRWSTGRCRWVPCSGWAGLHEWIRR